MDKNNDLNNTPKEYKEDSNILWILSLTFAILWFFVPFLLWGFILVFWSIILWWIWLKKKAKWLAIWWIVLWVIALITSPSFWILLAWMKNHNQVKEMQSNNVISQNIEQKEEKNIEVKKEDLSIYKNKDVIEKFANSFNKKINWIKFTNPILVDFEKYLIWVTKIWLIETFDWVKHYSKYENLGIALAYYEKSDENWNKIYMDSLEEFSFNWKNYILNEITNRKWDVYWYLIRDKDNFDIYIMQN